MKQTTKQPEKAQGRRGNEKPVTLAPLSFDEALDGLLATDARAVRELERKATEKRAGKKTGKK